jgi:hypothetical protein
VRPPFPLVEALCAGVRFAGLQPERPDLYPVSEIEDAVLTANDA